MDEPQERAPDLARIEALAHEAVAALPAPFAAAAREVAIRVEDWPEDDVLDELGIESHYDLTGLYSGVPLTERSVMDQEVQPPTIWLYRRPILDEWAERVDVGLAALVAHILVHELAHHFGWSDDDIAAVDPWWE